MRAASRAGDGAPWRTIYAPTPAGDALAGASSSGSAAPAPSTSATGRSCGPWPRSCGRPTCRSRSSARGETCTGDPARRAGNEYLFQMLAEENVATLSAAHDEHSDAHHRGQLPALLQHHPQRVPAVRPDRRGGDPPHPAARPPGGRWPARPDQHHEAVVAYHDACYLGRYNEVYDEGRRVVESVPGQSVVEMEQHHRKGHVLRRGWSPDVDGGARGHSASTTDGRAGARSEPPDEIATACPFCLVMLRDGITDLDRTDVAVRDVAELLADATGAWTLDADAIAPRLADSAGSGRRILRILDRRKRSQTVRFRADGAHGCDPQPQRRPALDDLDKAIIKAPPGRRAAAVCPDRARAAGAEATVRQRAERLISRGVVQVVGVTDPLAMGFQQPALIGLNVEAGAARARSPSRSRRWTRSPTSSSRPGATTSSARSCARTTSTCCGSSPNARRIDGIRSTETMVELRFVKESHRWGTR